MRFHDPVFEEIVRHLSVKHQLPERQIEALILSQFRLLKDTIERGDLESVRLPHIGLFCVKPQTVIDRYERETQYIRETTGNNGRVEEPAVSEQGDRGGSIQASEDLQHVSGDGHRG